MGDRANVVVQDENGAEVFLYTHWGGSELPGDVARALKDGRGRWDDPQYLARIVFCRMIPAESLLDETGFGISATLGDNEYPLIVLDTRTQEVRFEAERNRKVLLRVPFEEAAEKGLAYPQRAKNT